MYCISKQELFKTISERKVIILERNNRCILHTNLIKYEKITYQLFAKLFML